MAKIRTAPAEVTPFRTMDMKTAPVSRRPICIRPQTTATKSISTISREKPLWKPFSRPTPKRISIGAAARENIRQKEIRNYASTLRTRFVTIRRHSRVGLKRTPGLVVRRSLWKRFSRPIPKRISIGAFAREDMLQKENRLLKLQNRLALDTIVAKTRAIQWFRKTWRQEKQELQNRILKLESATDRL